MSMLPIATTADLPLDERSVDALLAGAQIVEARYSAEESGLLLTLNDGQQVLIHPEYDSPLAVFSLSAPNRVVPDDARR